MLSKTSFIKMDELKYYKLFVLGGLSPTDIHTKLVKLYTETTHSFPNAKKRAADFKSGRTPFEDDLLGGGQKRQPPMKISRRLNGERDN